MSSEAGTAEDRRKLLADRFRKANIPPRLWKTTTKDFRGSTLSTLFDYLESQARTNDLAEGIGLHLCGNPKLRPDLFGMVAKGHAAAGHGVELVTVHSLLYFLNHDADRRLGLSKVTHLFVDGFEKEFTGDSTCPYTYYQQIEVEEFLQSRRNGGLLNHYSTSNRWADVKWWTREFIASQSDAIRTIEL